MRMSVRRLLAEIDSRELSEWIEFANLESIESPTRLTAQLCSMLAGLLGQRIDADTFLGLPPAEPTPEELHSEDRRNAMALEGVAEAWFIARGREAEYRAWEAKRKADHGDDGRRTQG